MRIGIYNLHFATLGGGERRSSALAAHLAVSHDVTLYVLSPISAETIKLIFGVDLSSVEIVALEHTDHGAAISRRQPDLFINNSHGSDLSNPAPRGIYMCMFPDVPDVDLRSYHAITANSQFTAEWIARRWGYRADVVYSACRVMGPPAAKTRTVLNVARFFADIPAAHHKRQDVLLGAFKRLADSGFDDCQLHLVGMIGGRDDDRAYVDELRRAAFGHPISIRPNIDFDALRDAYRSASLYWHATGFGTSEREQPSKQEHFGMSIVEAMSAGAVPLAYNSGGPREIIESGVSGYLWSDVSELVALSRRLMNDPALLQSMSAAAVQRSRRFTVDEFLGSMDRIIARLTNDSPAATMIKSYS